MHPSRTPPWIAPIFLPHVGCPHRCVFCNQHLIAETLLAPSPSEVRDRLETYWVSQKPREGRRRQIAFYGGTFTGMAEERQDEYLEVCQPYVKRGWVDSIRISTRPDQVSERQLAFLADRGVRTVELGVQSLSDRVLKASRRDYTGQEARAAIRRTQEKGMEVGVQLMAGLPEDSGAESLETAAALSVLKPDFVRIYPLLILRQTELAERMQRGEYRPLPLEEAVALCALLLERLEGASIPVIRIGLQEQAEFGCQGSWVLAGPHHPAFGHLVRSAVFLRKALASLPGAVPRSASVCFRIHPHDRSLLAGHRGRNLIRIRHVLAPRQVRVEEDQRLPRGTVRCATG